MPVPQLDITFDALEFLARLERTEPGRLASWIRAQQYWNPMYIHRHNAFFVQVTRCPLYIRQGYHELRRAREDGDA